MKLSPLHLSFLIAAAVCAGPIQESRASLLVYEPFNYTGVQGPDLNLDGKTDLMGQNGGIGFTGAWTELSGVNGSPIAGSAHPLDYINGSNLAHSSGDLRFGTGGSLEILGFQEGKTTQTSETLLRSFEPIPLTEGSVLWFSILLRKNAELPVTGTTNQTRPQDKLEIALTYLADNVANNGFSMGDPADSTSFGISTNATGSTWPRLDGQGPTLGTTNLLVMKLSFERGKSTMEFFYNPSLNDMSPVSNLSVPLVDGPIDSGMELDLLKVDFGSSRAVWTLDEIRVGTTYADVVPEPSSLLLTGLGMAMFGGARLRRSRASQN